MLDCLAMGIDIGSEMHNQIAWYQELHVLFAEPYCVRNWMFVLSAPCAVALSFVEFIAVLRLVICGTKDVVLVILQLFRLA